MELKYMDHVQNTISESQVEQNKTAESLLK